MRRFLIFLLVIATMLESCKEKERQIISKDKSDSAIKNNGSIKSEKPSDPIKSELIGMIAPDFKLKTVSGTEFQLSSVKDKFIILDFWGSWCVPCIKDFPKMKEYYNKYRNEIEIVGIAYLDLKKNWKLSVKKHELEWVNVINDETKEQDLTITYGVNSFPTKFILNKKGEIIGKYGSTDDFYKKIDELMHQE